MKNKGIGFLGLLTLILITLKLTSFIDWSWWLVLLPLYGGFILGLVFIILVATLQVSGNKKRNVSIKSRNSQFAEKLKNKMEEQKRK